MEIPESITHKAMQVESWMRSNGLIQLHGLWKSSIVKRDRAQAEDYRNKYCKMKAMSQEHYDKLIQSNLLPWENSIDINETKSQE